MFDLDGRAALITGAASGIGAATAIRLAEAGADVTLCWYSGDTHAVDETVAAVESHGRKAITLEGDVSDTAAVDRFVRATLDGFGRLDIVVANAGITRDVASADLDDELWDRLIDINLTGVFRCFRAALPTMVEAGWGRLLATSSIAGGVQGWSRHVHYAASKGGIVGLVRSLALEVARDGITVNAVAPGVIVSPQTMDSVNSLGPAGLDAFAERIPIGRTGKPDDIAAVFAFLATKEAGYVTGQTLVVDGGATLSLV